MALPAEVTRLAGESIALGKSINEVKDAFKAVSNLERTSALAKFMSSFTMSFYALRTACAELDYEWDQRVSEDLAPRIQLKAELNKVGAKFKESEGFAEQLLNITSGQRSKIEDIRQTMYFPLPGKRDKLRDAINAAAQASAIEVDRLQTEINEKTTKAQEYRRELDRLNARHRKLLNDKRNTAFLQKILGQLKDTEKALDGIRSSANTVAAEISSLTNMVEDAKRQSTILGHLKASLKQLGLTLNSQSDELSTLSSTLQRGLEEAMTAYGSAKTCFVRVMDCSGGIDDATTSIPKKSIILDSLLGVMRAAIGIRYVDSTSLDILRNIEEKDDSKGSVKNILGFNIQGLKEDIAQGFVSPDRSYTIEGVEATLPRAT